MRLVKVILNSNISGNEKWDKTWRSLKTRLFLRKHVKRYYSPIYRQLKSVSYKSVFVIVNLLHQEQVIFEKMFFKKIVDPKSVIFQYLFNFSNFFLSYSYSFFFFFFRMDRMARNSYCRYYNALYYRFSFPSEIHKIYY